eukprot:737742-Hanusia_phi.AAC.1
MILFRSSVVRVRVFNGFKFRGAAMMAPSGDHRIPAPGPGPAWRPGARPPRDASRSPPPPAGCSGDSSSTVL